LLTRFRPLAAATPSLFPGDGSRPVVMLEFQDAYDAALYQAQQRLHDMYWKNRALWVQVIRG
jgi:hypothetical protein